MPGLFDPLRIRGVEFRNRAWMSPMCQYSADDGVPNDWHLVHLGARAQGGVGLAMVEATAVAPEGRISPWDLGLWNEQQQAAFERIVRFVVEQGATPAIQLAHAGRKASTDRPWQGGKPVSEAAGGWVPVGPSAIAYNEGYPVPHELTVEDIAILVEQFAEAARRAVRAGFQVVELHAAHGYLLHEFLSPLTNRREDDYGGSPEGRRRVVREVVSAVRDAIGDQLALFVRISASEYVEGGWALEDSVALSAELKALGVDLVDVSSGGNLPHQSLHPYPGYQVPFSRAIRERADLPTAAVGLITEPEHADSIVAGGDADAVLLGRELLRHPYWVQDAARALRKEIDWRPQYLRAKR
ncbi:MAG: NADH:flavin oxidoreductase/NADH oxidase [Dehalococcoidia bacterium]|nr:NADH:flavin oxidoreductase/NADH oxidase [Dehalococcoidia bacterium]